MKNLKLWIAIATLGMIGLGVQLLMSYQVPTIVTTVVPVAKIDTTSTENTVDSVFIDAIEHLKAYEGFRSEIYIDVDGSRTIGYGHHLLKGEKYQKISEKTATILLEKDLKARLEYIQAKYQISGDTLLALGLFSFNCGTGTLKRAIDNGILTKPTKLLKYCHYKTYNNEGIATVHTSHKLLQRRKYELALITQKH